MIRPYGIVKKCNYVTSTLSRHNILKNPPSYFSDSVKNNHYVPINNRPTSKYNEMKKPILEFAMIISVATLCFFAIDNYRVRTGLQEKVESEQIKMKEAQEFLARQMNAARKKRELQILNERKMVKMREMKLSLHVAMLRKQLQDHDIQPKSIEECVNEYENIVKMENSISNVSGTMLWVADDSNIKGYIPNVREYDVRLRSDADNRKKEKPY